ncbi:AMP-dependent synthetase/ligase [Luteimicrobium subarcticum]|uniref:Long-chain acyl-CoA synthetase n=1 Tax=Luteimicrobium subarcticum TaxID=620910 RepID=A0A2M8WJ97_9MICO|nr:long-chain fatty acid--CoA ligase [Luteimicrobium subarcticum]PJI90999.1 long-chain acyl-CoA synthetase [Luteimicrobium subarcticum]
MTATAPQTASSPTFLDGTDVDLRIDRSIATMYRDRLATSPANLAFREPDGSGGWTDHTWRQVDDRVRPLAAGLLALGIARGDRVALMAPTSYTWIVVDLAVQVAGAAATSIYPVATPDVLEWILADSASRVLVVQDAALLEQVRAVRAQASALELVVVIDPADVELQDGETTLAELAASGARHLAAEPRCVDEAGDVLVHDDLATLIYTSGTTGRPKGVRLTHGNWAGEAAGIDALGILTPEHTQLLWLPLAHVFAQTFVVTQLRVGYPTAVDGSIPDLVGNLATARPAFMAAAPRIFEKVHAGITAQVEAKGGVSLALFRWAVRTGEQKVRAQQAGEQASWWVRAQAALGSALVFSKVRKRFGGNLQYFISGSAPLSREILEFFEAAGLPILEGYGLTETSAAITVNLPGRSRFGTVGPVLPGHRIQLASDGEILAAGPCVTAGYFQNAEATAESVEDGWFHTGDIGEIVDGRYLKIVDRKKDLFKTSNGKYVAPGLVEVTLTSSCALVGQAVVVGAGRSYCVALVSVDSEELARFASAHGLTGDYAELVHAPEVQAEIRQAVERTNGKFARWEQIKKFAVLDTEITVESNELTPSLKLRRKPVVEKHADLIDSLYS